MARAARFRVSAISLLSPERASVTYTVLIDGTPLVRDAAGEVVKQGGTWKVAKATFCELLASRSVAPPTCG